jgi:hypothetical protein
MPSSFRFIPFSAPDWRTFGGGERTAHAKDPGRRDPNEPRLYSGGACVAAMVLYSLPGGVGPSGKVRPARRRASRWPISDEAEKLQYKVDHHQQTDEVNNRVHPALLSDIEWKFLPVNIDLGNERECLVQYSKELVCK